MHIGFHITIVVFLFKAICAADLQNCKDSNKNQYKVCVIGEGNYNRSQPLELNTTLHLHEIVSIDEDENSIGIQAMLISTWEKDPELNISDT